MWKNIVALVVLCGLTSRPVHAQIPVTDVAAIVQLVNIVRNVSETIQLMRQEYQTIQRIARGYGGQLAGYRISALPPLNHDVERFQYAAALLEGLNAGDPRGDRYNATVLTVLRPGGLFARLPPNARKVMEAAFAGIEIADSIATLGIHESADARGYAQRIAQLIQRLQDDVTAPGQEFHEVTAIADKLALAGLIDARLNQNSNQIQSSILEQQIAKNMRLREGLAAQVNMSITRMNDNGQSTDAIVGGATDALKNWRLR